jgi:hypothetical protein
MKNALLCVLLLWSSLSLARDRDWKDAVYLGMTTSVNGAAAIPIGNMIVAAPLGGRTYWFKCDGVTYALATNYTGRWPNLTVNGHAKLAVEGRNAHVLDEDNKDRKFSIIEKAVQPQ